jgi:hypothetical protein
MISLAKMHFAIALVLASRAREVCVLHTLGKYLATFFVLRTSISWSETVGNFNIPVQ